MKVVVISDTHSLQHYVTAPKGDVLIHAGDFTGVDSILQLELFFEWFISLPHKDKILIAGNHDRCFEHKPTKEFLLEKYKGKFHYLEDSSVIIDNIKFYGSPWQPEFCNWAFNLPRGKALKEKWDLIELDTDVLITHGPPYGILDKCDGGNVGCEDLLEAIKRLDLRFHVFGHIHEGYGKTKKHNIKFINASICNGVYSPINKPIVFNI